MAQKLLSPIIASNKYIEELEQVLVKSFKDSIYIPLVKMLNSSKTIQNSQDDILGDIRSGKITFHHGAFKGKFNSKLSRELRKLGAIWDKKTSSFKIQFKKLPPEMREVINLSETRFRSRMRKLDKKIAESAKVKVVDTEIVAKIFSKSIFRIDSEIGDSLEGIVVTPKFSAAERKRITDEYSKNMDLYIKRWTEKEIKNLRGKIKKHTLSGLRHEDMISTIEKSYGVSKSKAKFLARQETKLLVSKMKEVRYTSVGLDEYIWTNVIASPKHPVRDSHKRLNGKKFRFSDPPVVNEKGEKKNPGEDYGCRCTARVIVTF